MSLKNNERYSKRITVVLGLCAFLAILAQAFLYSFGFKTVAQILGFLAIGLIIVILLRFYFGHLLRVGNLPYNVRAVVQLTEITWGSNVSRVSSESRCYWSVPDGRDEKEFLRIEPAGSMFLRVVSPTTRLPGAKSILIQHQ